MQTLNLIEGFPFVTILQPSEYYDFVMEPPVDSEPSVVFIQTRSGTFKRERCGGVICNRCPFLEVSFRDYRIPLDQNSYENAYCNSVDGDLFIRTILSPLRITKTKDLHEPN